MKNILAYFKTPIARGGKIPSRIEAKIDPSVRVRVGAPMSLGDNINAVSGVVVSANWLGDVVLDTTRS